MDDKDAFASVKTADIFDGWREGQQSLLVDLVMRKYKPRHEKTQQHGFGTCAA